MTDTTTPHDLNTVEREWIFTFGFGHVHPVTGESLARKYVKIRGTVETSRDEMVRRYGRKWATQYFSEERAGVKRYGLTEYMGDMTIEDMVDELTYRSYAHNRALAPDVPAARWASVFKGAAMLETRYQREIAAKKAGA